MKEKKELHVNVNHLIDLLECIQDSNEDDIVLQTIDEVITVIYDIAEGK